MIASVLINVLIFCIKVKHIQTYVSENQILGKIKRRKYKSKEYSRHQKEGCSRPYIRENEMAGMKVETSSWVVDGGSLF